MSFDPTNPKNAESPALFPAENRRNMLRLQELFDANHQFNDTTATNDGWHKIIEWVQQGSDPIDPLDPSADAPTSPDDAPITWEQPDIYGVDRPWFRTSNNGNLIAMSGEFEVRGTITLNGSQQTIVTPPDNTIGTLMLYSINFAGNLSLILSAVFASDGVKTAVNQTSTIGTNDIIISGSNSIIQTPNISVINTTGFNGVYDWRLYYRYI